MDKIDYVWILKSRPTFYRGNVEEYPILMIEILPFRCDRLLLSDFGNNYTLGVI